MSFSSARRASTPPASNLYVNLGIAYAKIGSTNGRLTREQCCLFFAGERTSKNCQLVSNARLLQSGRIVCACHAVHDLYKAVRVES